MILVIMLVGFVMLVGFIGMVIIPLMAIKQHKTIKMARGMVTSGVITNPAEARDCRRFLQSMKTKDALELERSLGLLLEAEGEA